MPENNTKIALLEQSHRSIEHRFNKLDRSLTNLPNTLKDMYTTKIEFMPVKEKAERHAKIFLYLGTLILGAIVTAILKLIMLQG